jgi:hypothetical protein
VDGAVLTCAVCNLALYAFCCCCRLHFALTICYNFWVMWVLARYFKDFVLVRQHYLSKGGIRMP